MIQRLRRNKKPGSTAAVAPATGRDLHTAADVYTDPTPYDVALDHDRLTVHAAQSFPLGQLADALPTVAAMLATEASRRGCVAVYSVQHQITTSGPWLIVTMMGTGARPSIDPDQPAGRNNT